MNGFLLSVLGSGYPAAGAGYVGGFPNRFPVAAGAKVDDHPNPPAEAEASAGFYPNSPNVAGLSAPSDFPNRFVFGYSACLSPS